MTIAIDSSTLLAALNAQYGIRTSSSTGAGASSTAKPANPTPPWSGTSTATLWSQLTQEVMAGGKFFDPNAAKLDVPGDSASASQNYRNLFALYRGLTALQGLAQNASTTVTATQKAQIAKTFQAGMTQLEGFLQQQPFKGFQVYQNDVMASDKASVAAPSETDTYQTGVLYSGSVNGEVPAFQGAVKFDLTVTRYSGAQVPVSFDLSEMGSTPRTMGAVVSYLNSKLEAAGVATRFASVVTPGKPQTIQAGKTTVTLPAGPDQYALQIKGVSVEGLSFSAPASDPAVYVAEASGVSADSVQQIVKYEAGSGALATSAANGQVFNTPLGSGVAAARAVAAAPDGSVYALEDVTGTTAGQSIQGSRDVALVKYDSAGNVVFTRTLGAADSASGFALSVSADGSQVAIAGQVNGQLDPTASTTTAATAPQQGFVTVFDSSGQEQWTQQTGTTTGDPVQANAVAFGPNDMVYVAGQTDSKLSGASASVGRTDAYLQAFHAVATPLNDGSGGSTWTAVSTFVDQYGTTSQDRATGLAVSGSTVYVSSVEAGHGVVRSFDQSGSGSTSLTANAVRDLGDLQGGSVAGVAVNADGSVAVAGSTHNGALDAGTVTQAYAGGQAGFVASLGADLAPAGGDRLTYVGDGTADVSASAVAVAGGEVYVAGQVSTPPIPGSAQTSGYRGYVTQIDPQTGASTWSQQALGLDGQLAPSSIAVSQTGASVLDRLGLPTGAIDYTVSDNVVANTSVRAGDEFFVASGGGAPQAVRIEAGDTFQTLAGKIARASGYTATASLVTEAGGRQLEIKPAFSGRQIQLLAGPAGKDALAPLGLAEGVLSSTASSESSLAPVKTQGSLPAATSLKNGYSLKLSSTLDINDPTDLKAALAALGSSLSTVRSIYSGMVNPPPKTSAASGTVPKYLTDQLANYQAALARLTGGDTSSSSSSSSTGSPLLSLFTG